MLTEQMIRLISAYTIGCVATVRPDGAPAVSPKGTFLVFDDRTIAFANIRSQGTVENIRRDPRVEVDFIDVFGRKGCRISGLARYVAIEDAEPGDRTMFRDKWPDLYDLVRGIVFIDVVDGEDLSSPSYDIGAVRSELAEKWLRQYADVLGFAVMKQP